MKILAKIKTTEFFFLLLTSIAFFLLRFPSLFEPYWYGDEGIYEVIGYALRHGRFLYSGIWDNKPPMLYLIYALFQGDQFPVRLFSLLIGLFSVLALFSLAKKLFTSSTAVFITTTFFAILFGVPFLEGNIANAENFMLLPAILAGILVYQTFHHTSHERKSLHILHYKILNTKYYMLFAAGVLLGISFLIKVVAIFDLAAFTFFLLFVNTKKHTIYEFFQNVLILIPFALGFVSPFLVTSLVFLLHGTLQVFITSAFLSNVGYVNYGNQFIIPQGLLVIKLVILMAICMVLFVKRNSLSSSTLFIGIWLVFSLFNALFAQRPYTHYTLVILPSLALLIGLLLELKKLRIVIIISAIIVIAILFKNFYFYPHFLSYYQNFLDMVTNKKDIDTYDAFFDKATVRDRTIASYINTHLKKGQSIFLWGNSGQVYRLTNTLPPGRFIVAYHIDWTQSNKKETTAALFLVKPQFIVIYPNQDALPYSLSLYKERVIIDGATIYERLY